MKLKLKITSLILTLLTQTFPCAAQGALRYEADPKSSRIEFSARSTLHTFHGLTRRFNGQLIAESEDSPELRGEITVPVNELSTGNGSRDQNMRKMFQSEIYPDIICRIDSLKINEQAETGHIVGELTIMDQTKPFEADVAIERDSTAWKIYGETTVSLADYDLHPPTVLKLIKVSDAVNVGFEVRFEENQRSLP